MDCRNKLRIVYGDVTVGVHGEGFDYIFQNRRGMESLVKEEKNSCTAHRDPHSGERLRIMTGETDFR